MRFSGSATFYKTNGRARTIRPGSATIQLYRMIGLLPGSELASFGIAITGIDDRGKRIIRIIFPCGCSLSAFCRVAAFRLIAGSCTLVFKIMVCHASHLPTRIILTFRMANIRRNIISSPQSMLYVSRSLQASLLPSPSSPARHVPTHLRRHTRRECSSPSYEG